MPEGEDLQNQIAGRHRRGTLWLMLFQFATISGIVVLSALLFNVINQAFGLVAIQNEFDDRQLVTAKIEGKVVSAPNTTTSENDDELANAVAADPYAIGFFGYAFYDHHADELRTVAIDGIEPNAATVTSAAYPLARKLYLYSSYQIMEEQPQVASFIDFYLSNVNDFIEEVGYFPLEQADLDVQLNTLRTDLAMDLESPETLNGEINVGGSSTVFPLTQALADAFQAGLFQGEVAVASAGTKAGFQQLCVDETNEIADASVAMSRQVSTACAKSKRVPAEYWIGADAIAVVVSQQNSFLNEATNAELQQIFTTAEKWSDINPEWPQEAIKRYIPSIDSGTLEFFVEQTYSDVALADFSKQDLLEILEANVSAGLMRRFEKEGPMAERDHGDLHDLVMERVVQPAVVMSWNLIPSIFNRDEIEVEAFAAYPEAKLTFHSWINRSFLSNTQSSTPEQAGVRTAILGSLWVILITVVFAVPVGIGAAVYLEEYASHGRLHRILQTNIDNLAGVPSIIYGILGLAIFVRAMEPLTSGKAIGVADPTTANGRTILAAGLTLGLLVLPIIIINAQEAIRAVPSSLREAGYGLGATKWQVVRSHVLANALPGILTGAILAMSRAVGETAPLIVIGASTFITVDPTTMFSKFTVLPMQIYQWTTRPQPEFQHIAAAASIVLLVLLLLMNASAIMLRNRFSKRI